jgi:hypothetical protein
MLEKTFDPQTAEPRLYAAWEASGAFAPTDDTSGQPFSIVIPPPNVTGSLHIGHALNNTLQDVLTRYRRMRGDAALWLPGTDHAGIATQMVVERQLAAEAAEHPQVAGMQGGDLDVEAIGLQRCIDGEVFPQGGHHLFGPGSADALDHRAAGEQGFEGGHLLGGGEVQHRAVMRQRGFGKIIGRVLEEFLGGGGEDAHIGGAVIANPDGGAAAGGVKTRAVLGLEQHHAMGIGEVGGDGGARHARADDDGICRRDLHSRTLA